MYVYMIYVYIYYICIYLTALRGTHKIQTFQGRELCRAAMLHAREVARSTSLVNIESAPESVLVILSSHSKRETIMLFVVFGCFTDF